MISNEEIFKDKNVVIRHIGPELICEWKSYKPINRSYMEAKLVEYIGNTFAGAWKVKDLEEAKTSRGLRCFTLTWIRNMLEARWI